eukprot:9258963-Pyramimonas_sp.AAC.1
MRVAWEQCAVRVGFVSDPHRSRTATIPIGTTITTTTTTNTTATITTIVTTTIATAASAATATAIT